MVIAKGGMSTPLHNRQDNRAASAVESAGRPWDEEVDVLVVGFGAAGAVAALQAHADGAKVMLIDRFDGGGTTARSGGVVYAGGTSFQADAGFEDDPDNMYRYLETEVGDAVKPETLRRFCLESAANLDWLVEQGMAFSSAAHIEKASFPPEGKFLYYSGNEKAPANTRVARPVPRGHRPVGAGFGGPHFHRAMAERVAATEIDLRIHCRASRLIRNDAGEVIGAELLALAAECRAEHAALHARSNPMNPKPDKRHAGLLKRIEAIEAAHSTQVRVRVRKGVILATGGHAFSPKLIREFSPTVTRANAKFHRLATLGNDGSGFEMARAAGGAPARMDSLYIARHLVPAALVGGLLVNSSGRRFVAEDAYISSIGDAISREAGGVAWLIINAATLRRTLRQVFGSGWHLLRYFGIRTLPNLLAGGTRRSSSLRRLAAKLGLPAHALIKTAETHDGDCDAGRADALGKSPEARTRLGNGPYYAINMKFSNPRAITLLMTLGGLGVDEESGAALDEAGRPIRGLYAAGNCAVGLHSNSYISGLAIADCVFSGRRAGRAVAAR